MVQANQIKTKTDLASRDMEITAKETQLEVCEQSRILCALMICYLNMQECKRHLDKLQKELLTSQNKVKKDLASKNVDIATNEALEVLSQIICIVMSVIMYLYM